MRVDNVTHPNSSEEQQIALDTRIQGDLVYPLQADAEETPTGGTTGVG